MLTQSSARNVLVFGDLGVDVYPFLCQLLSHRDLPCLLTSFLGRVAASLRLDISNLPRLRQEHIPPLKDLSSFLATYNSSRGRSAAVDNAVLSIAQLAHWISASELSSEWLSEGICSIGSIGLSTGLLAAAVSSAGPLTASTIDLAVEVVRISFRLGCEIDSISAQLQTDYGAGETWSFFVSNAASEKVEEAIASSHFLATLPVFKQPYVSSTSPSGVVVSGPPEALSQLVGSCDLFTKSIPQDIVGLYHAPHLYNATTVREILKTGDRKTQDLFAKFSPQLAIFSASQKTSYTLNNMQTLLEELVADILMEPLDVSQLLEQCSTQLSLSKSSCRLVSVGPSSAMNELAISLQARTEKSVTILEPDIRTDLTSSRDTANMRNSKIAIVGMSGRFPGGSDVEEFWDVLQRGLDMHKEVPPDRFDAKAHFDPAGKTKNTSHTPFGCFLDNAGLFDPRFFNMSPREATQTDPMQRLALITAYEALEMSGYVANRTPSTKLDRIGVFYGQTSDDWREINEAQDIDTYFITGGVRAFGPGRINYHFKFMGPSFSIDTACSSSAAAIQLACTSLWAGDCDTAVTGGCNIMTNPDIFSGLSRGQFLSKVGPCQTFDNDADGYCRGDGVGTVILKRLEDAEADNDNILGVILAAATNHSADAISITHPHDATQEILYKNVLRRAGVDPLDISYVEMHGTGTQAGDGTEMRSVTNVFAPRDRLRQSHQPLHIGSVKANIGHGEAASGISALIKVLMMLRKNSIPPHIGIKGQINTGFPKDLALRNIHIPFHETPYPRGQDKRFCFVNNFSAAGGNTALVIEDAPSQKFVCRDPRPVHVVAVSARALSSIKANLQNLINHIDAEQDIHLPSLSYTTTARRTHHNYRISFPAANVQQLRSSLVNAVASNLEPANPSTKVAFTFTGQGSHYAGMATDLFETSASFRRDILRFESTAAALGYPSFLPLIQGTAEEAAQLSAIPLQVGLACIQIALTQLWASWGVKPDLVIGHSLGEYAALYASGVLAASDVIYLVGERARLLEGHCTPGTHAMLAVKSGMSDLLQVLLSGDVEVACINSTTETILSGRTPAIEAAKRVLDVQGLKSQKLNVPYAFHSSQVDTITSDFERIASSVIFRKPTVPFLSPLLSTVQAHGRIDASYLARHAREPVNFIGALKAGQDSKLIDGPIVWVEIGPHPVSLNFVKSTCGTSVACGPSLRRNESGWHSLSGTCSVLYNNGINVHWNEFHRDFSNAHVLLELPAYSFALKNYWIDYKNNWCLTKGDLPTQLPPPVPTLSTTTVQKIVEQRYSDGKGFLLAESEISRPDLFATISGHMINGTRLCPSTIYTDIAVTVGTHMYRQMWELAEADPIPGINVKDVHVPKTLIAEEDGHQVLKIEAHMEKDKDRIKLSLSTGTTEHATCIIEFSDTSSWVSEWQRTGYLVQDRMAMLQKRAEDGEIHSLRRGMVYKLFGAFIQLKGSYQGIERMAFDGHNMEAVADVALQPVPEDRTFVCPPYWIESWGHLSGFVVNCNDNLDSESQVYISHGWESFRLLRPFSAEKKYRTYVRMLPAEKNVLVGDVYLFEGDEVVGLIGGLKFHCIPRKVLDVLLPKPGVAKASAASAKAKPASTMVAKADTTVEYGGRSVTVHKTVTITSQVLNVIAEECGVDLSELADGNSFADLGVDSLMQLAISGRMREDLELEVHSTIFTDHPTIGALKAYLSSLGPATSSDFDPPSPPEPALISDHSSSNDDSSPRQATPSNSDHREAFAHNEVSQALKAIVSHDAEIYADDVTPKVADTVLSQLLMPVAQHPQRFATSVLLQGSPKIATKTFFIFPDGGGSATSYVGIPNISPDVCVFGLNSPYMKTPHEYTCPLPQIAKMFVAEIRRRKPEGPYYVGGWSAGGVIAYEGARQLIESGAEVASLILIDSPCPLIIEPLPISLHRWFASIGLLGDGEFDVSKLPAWLLPHFQASITALSGYTTTVTPLDPEKAPETYAIWCRDGICKEPTDPRPDPYPYGHAQWLLESKTDFGPDQWDNFIPAEKIHCSSVGGNHFSMMKSPNIQHLGEEIRKAMAT